MVGFTKFRLITTGPDSAKPLRLGALEIYGFASQICRLCLLPDAAFVSKCKAYAAQARNLYSSHFASHADPQLRRPGHALSAMLDRVDVKLTEFSELWALLPHHK